jgi:hypothetical protein
MIGFCAVPRRSPFASDPCLTNPERQEREGATAPSAGRSTPFNDAEAEKEEAMKTRHILPVLFLVGVFGVAVAAGQELVQEAIPNWPAPATWSPHSVSRGASTMGAVTSPLPFIGLTPCRIADTRNAPGPYGAPALAGGVPRNFTLTGQCGIPTGAFVASLNVTVTNTAGPGFILIYPAGGSQPLVSTLNYVANQTIANAAVVPLGAGGGVTVIAGVSGTDLILDVNGYYAPAGVGTQNTFLGRNAGNFTMTGDANAGFGYNALFSNTTGPQNTATGNAALYSNTTGGGNTASGSNALRNNTTGSSNTATGEGALTSNTTGGGNTANGAGALYSNTTGSLNTAIGSGALQSTTGFRNIGIGQSAGANLTTGSDNICIVNYGVAGESATIRVGTVGTQTATFVAGVHGVTTGGTGIPVLIDANGQLGTISSSARFKDEIQDMGEATEGLLRLRPVTFRYKAQPEGRTQFGLIAEEVEKVMPELVVCSSSGEVETVLYHEMPAMLLNELQKQQLEIQKQQREAQDQQREIQELKSELSALRAIIGQK